MKLKENLLKFLALSISPLLVSCGLISGGKSHIYELKPLLTANERSAIVGTELKFDGIPNNRNITPAEQEKRNELLAKKFVGTEKKGSHDPTKFLTGIETSSEPRETSKDLLYFLRHLGSSSNSITKQKRNRLVAFLVLRSDELVNQHHKAIFSNAAGGNLTFGNLAALSTGGALAFKARSTQTALTAASGVFQTSKSLWNEEIFFGIVAGKIVETIAKERNSIMNTIRTNMTLSPDKFGLSEAIVLVEKYHDAGSFQKGLINVIGDGIRGKSTIDLIQEYDKLSEMKNSTGNVSEGAKLRMNSIKKQLDEN